MADQKYIDGLTEIFEAASSRFMQGEEIEKREKIPVLSNDIPLDINRWLKVENVTCVFIDMKNSTQLSVQNKDRESAGIYQYFTGTAVKILNHFNAAYIDVRGDGAFGLFDSNRTYHALAAAITFKTFCDSELPSALSSSGHNITSHIGMDRKTVLVKKVGLRRVDEKTDKQNEVWAGKPVNIASKLASMGGENDLHISERVFNKFYSDMAIHVLDTCGCPDGHKKKVWEQLPLQADPRFDFEKIYKLTTDGWCRTHGKEFCQNILALDNRNNA